MLISKESYLIDFLINEYTRGYSFVISVDSKNLVRYWDLKNNSTMFIFKIPFKRQVTAVDIDKKCFHIAAGSSDGEALVINSKAGGILYRLTGATEEITKIKFLHSGSK